MPPSFSKLTICGTKRSCVAAPAAPFDSPPGLRRGPRRRGEAHHAPLHLAAVLRARDDLLARIAALLEVDAAQLLEIDHLRHEEVLRGSRDQGAPGLNLL